MVIDTTHRFVIRWRHDRKIRLADLGRPAVQVACAILFLASDEATYITGHTLVVDGGWRAK